MRKKVITQGKHQNSSEQLNLREASGSSFSACGTNQAFFWTFRKNSSPKKLKAEKNSREFSEKLKLFLEKLTILPNQIANI